MCSFRFSSMNSCSAQKCTKLGYSKALEIIVQGEHINSDDCEKNLILRQKQLRQQHQSVANLIRFVFCIDATQLYCVRRYSQARQYYLKVHRVASCQRKLHRNNGKENVKGHQQVRICLKTFCSP